MSRAAGRLYSRARGNVSLRDSIMYMLNKYARIKKRIESALYAMKYGVHAVLEE